MAKTVATRIMLFVLLAIAVGVAGYFAGRLTAGAPDQEGAATERIIAYWRAPMDPSEIHDGPGKSRMGMDLIPVYADELDGSGSADPSALSGERQIRYWRAPMDPTEIYDAPGKSRMGMDLIPVYADEVSASGGVVRIDPEVVQSMGVRTAFVRQQDFSRIIRTVGDVSYDEERLQIVNSKVSGWIEKLFVNFVGEQVVAGQPLMEIYSPELVSTQEEYLLAVRGLRSLGLSASDEIIDDARRVLDATRTRLKYWDIPDEEVERLATTGEVRKTIRINAPATGIVIERNAIDGAHIQAGSDLFRIADIRSVWVHASFYDNEVPWIRVGQPAEMELSYLPGKVYHGVVSYIYPYLREKARDVHVRLVFNNTSTYDLKPGMYANVRLEGRAIPDAVVIPNEAVIRSGERTLVFVVLGEGTFEPREIKLGEVGGAGNAEVRVLDGLLPGEEIVVSAQFMLDSESRLQEAVQKMLAGKKAPQTDDSMVPIPAAAPTGGGGQPGPPQAPPTPPMDHSTMDHAAPPTDSTAAHRHDPDSTHSGN